MGLNEYIVRIVLKARNELGSAFRDAAAEVEKLTKNEKEHGQSQKANEGAVRSSMEAQKGLTQAHRAAREEVQKHTGVMERLSAKFRELRASTEASTRPINDAAAGIHKVGNSAKEARQPLTDLEKAIRSVRTAHSDTVFAVEKAAATLRKSTLAHKEVGHAANESAAAQKHLSSATREVAQETERAANASQSLKKEAKGVTDVMSDTKVTTKELAANVHGLGAAFAIKYAQAFVTALVSLGGQLVAVGAAAAQAGLAIGGAFSAGLAQAVPTIGLLAGAFSRLTTIIKAVEAQYKTTTETQAQHLQTTNALIGAHEAETNAAFGVRQAYFNLEIAQRSLTDARREALRNIQDLNLAEVEAANNARAASQAYGMAQNTLAKTVATGGSVQDVQQASLNVDEAKSRLDKSGIDQQRAKEDAARARKRGVGGSTSVLEANNAVVSASHGIITSNQALAASQRELAIATLTADSAVNALNEALQLLDPTERKVYNTLVHLREDVKKTIQPITDIIVSSFGNAFTQIDGLLKNAPFIGSLTRLSTAIAGGVKQLSTELTRPGTVKQYTNINQQAASNVPIISKTAVEAFRIFMEIVKAGQPILHKILIDIRDFATRIDNYFKTKPGTNFLKQTFDDGLKSLEAFGRLFTSVMKLFFALLPEAGRSGRGTIDELTAQIDKATAYIRGHQEDVRKFFDKTKKVVEEIAGVIFSVGQALATAFDPNAVAALAGVLKDIVIPALRDAVIIIGTFTTLIHQLLSIPFVATFAKLAATMIAVGLGLDAIREGGKALAAMFGKLWATPLGRLSLLIVLIIELDKKFHILGKTIDWVKDHPLVALGIAFVAWKVGVVSAIDSVMLKMAGLLTRIPFIGKAFAKTAVESEVALATVAAEEKVVGVEAQAAAVKAASIGPSAAGGAGTGAIVGAGEGAVAGGLLSRLKGLGGGLLRKAAPLGAIYLGSDIAANLAPKGLARNLIANTGKGAVAGAVAGGAVGSLAGPFAAVTATGGGVVGGASAALTTVVDYFTKGDDGSNKKLTALTDKIKDLQKQGGPTIDQLKGIASQANLLAAAGGDAADSAGKLNDRLTGVIRSASLKNLRQQSSDFLTQLRGMKDTLPTLSFQQLEFLSKKARDLANNGGKAADALHSLSIELKGDASRAHYFDNLNGGAKSVIKSFQGMQDSTGSILDNIKANVKSNIDTIAKDMGIGSAAGKQALTANFAEAITNVDLSIQAGKTTTRKGMDAIHGYMKDALKTYGVKTSDLASFFSKSDPQAGVDAGVLVPGPYSGGLVTGKSKKRATGGWIGNAGERGSDMVHAVLGRGEAILNFAHQPIVNAGLAAIGYRGGLSDLFNMVRGEHAADGDGYARGGYVQGAFPNNAVGTPSFINRLFDRGFNVTSAFRPGARTGSGNVSDHASGHAWDFGNSVNSMQAVWNAVFPLRAQIKQLFGPTPQSHAMGYNYGAGFDQAGTANQAIHENHIHLALGGDVKGAINGKNVGGTGGGGGGPSIPQITLPKVGTKGDSPFAKLIAIATGQLRTVAQKKLDAVYATLSSSGGDIGTASGKLVPGILNIAKHAAFQAGVPFDANIVKELLLKESGGGKNLAPHNYGGILDPAGPFQVIGSTFKAFAAQGHGNRLNPVDNADAAFKYIKAQYHTLQQLATRTGLFGNSYKGYARGGLVTMYDTITGKGVPRNAAAVASYVDNYRGFSKIGSYAPKAKRVAITVTPGNFPDADIVDIEPKGHRTTEAGMIPWFKRMLKKGRKPGAYGGRKASADYNLPHLVQRLKSAGIDRSKYSLWLADWNNQTSVPSGYDAHQYKGGTNVDLSVAKPSFFSGSSPDSSGDDLIALPKRHKNKKGIKLPPAAEEVISDAKNFIADGGANITSFLTGQAKRLGLAGGSDISNLVSQMESLVSGSFARGGFAKKNFAGWFGSGTSTTVTKPTQFGAGENGPEHVTITPAGSHTSRSVSNNPNLAELLKLQDEINSLTRKSPFHSSLVLVKSIFTHVQQIDKELSSQLSATGIGFEATLNALRDSAGKLGDQSPNALIKIIRRTKHRGDIDKAVNQLEQTTLPTLETAMSATTDALNARLKRFSFALVKGKLNRTGVGQDPVAVATLNVENLNTELSEITTEKGYVQKAITAVTARMKAAKGDNRKKLQVTLNGLKQKLGGISNTQADLLDQAGTAQEAAQAATSEKIGTAAGLATSFVDTARRGATSLGAVGVIPGLDRLQQAIVESQIREIQVVLKQAKSTGNKALETQLTQQLNDLSAQAVELITQRITSSITATETLFSRKQGLIDIGSRIADLADKTQDYVGGAAARAGVLNATNSNLSTERAGYTSALADAIATKNEGLISDLTTKIAALDQTVAENKLALKDNSAHLADAQLANVSSTSSFLSSAAQTARSYYQTIGKLTGKTPIPSELDALKGEEGQLNVAGNTNKDAFSKFLHSAGFQFSQGDLNNTGDSLIKSLQKLAADPQTANFTTAQQTTFQQYITALLSNTNALAENKLAIRDLTGNITQSFSTTAFELFRTAIFNGNNGLLPQFQIPSMSVGGDIINGGLVHLHDGETVKPAKVSLGYKGGDATEHNNYYFETPMEIADPGMIASEISWRKSLDRAA